MKLRNFLLPSFCLLLLLSIAPKAFAQRAVLFETFTNEDDPCLKGTGGILPARTAFNQSVIDVVNSKGSKIIHFNHHFGNEADNLQIANSSTIAHLLGAGDTLFWGAVDRSSQIYSSQNTNNSNRLSLSSDDWSSAIDFETGQPTIATLSLVSAELDTLTLQSIQQNILTTNIAVTLNQDITDGLVIRYAILQDNVQDAQCGTNSPKITLDDVVRYATILDTGTFVVSGSAGTVNVYSNQEINARTAVLQEKWDYSNLRLVAYLEEAPKGNFQVINAATLIDKPGMNSMPLPAASLTLMDSDADGKIFNPGPIGFSVRFRASNVRAVNEYYSIDSGQTWNTIVDTAKGNSWPYLYASDTVPNIEINNKGKIKIVDADDPTVFDIEKGTFSIHVTPTLAILHPQSTDTLKADSTFLIQWADVGVGTVKLEYSYAPYATWKLIQDQVPGTSFLWNPVPDTYYVAKIQITPDKNETSLQQSTSFVIKKTVGLNGVDNSIVPSPLTITSIAPNPAENGQELTIRYADQSAPQITMELLDLLGHTAYSRTFFSSPNGEVSIPTQSLSAGAYIVRMTDGTSTVTKRVEIIR